MRGGLPLQSYLASHSTSLSPHRAALRKSQRMHRRQSSGVTTASTVAGTPHLLPPRVHLPGEVGGARGPPCCSREKARCTNVPLNVLEELKFWKKLNRNMCDCNRLLISLVLSRTEDRICMSRVRVPADPPRSRTHFWKQCAANSTQRRLSRLAPQWWEPHTRRLPCPGQRPSSTSVPPTMHKWMLRWRHGPGMDRRTCG